MANTDNPYLCGGTFLAQILRARKSPELPVYYNKNKKESLSEQETFRRLISIYHIAEFSSCSSLKTYTSQFKSCTNSLESFALFSDSDVKREFDSDVRSADSSALTMMSDFVQEFIDTEKYIQLVRCLLDMIENGQIRLMKSGGVGIKAYATKMAERNEKEDTLSEDMKKGEGNQEDSEDE